MDFDPSGVEVSGGEGQKIAIARAMYKNADLMILDEPTAALDPRSENEIYTIVGNAILEHTAIFISHRLSACKLCQQVIVLHNGELIEEGTHDELVQKGWEISGIMEFAGAVFTCKHSVTPRYGLQKGTIPFDHFRRSKQQIRSARYPNGDF